MGFFCCNEVEQIQAETLIGSLFDEMEQALTGAP